MKKGAYQHHLIQYELPQKVQRTCKDCITFHLTNNGQLEPDDRHADGVVFDFGLKPGQKAIILSIDMTFCTNDTDRNVELELQDIFGASPTLLSEGHPDVTGKVRFLLSRHANGIVPKSNRLLYEPNFMNLGFPVIQYAGLEHCILNARSTAISYEGAPEPDFEVFKRADHLIVFILQNVTQFKEIGKHDIILLPDNEHYKVSKRAIKVIRSFFETTVFTLFRYTTQNHMKLAWAMEMKPPPELPDHLMTPSERKHSDRKNGGFSIIVVFLKATFIVIQQETPRFMCSSKNLFI